jgi:hypothetical protein
MPSEQCDDTSIHEAGHAVADRRLISDPQLWGPASVVAIGTQLGRAQGAGRSHCWDGADAAAVITSLCSGYAALVAAGRCDEVAAIGCDQDFAEASGLSQEWGLGGDLDRWKRKAVDLMRRPENVEAVRLVADWLSRRQELDSDLIDLLIEIADGDAAEADLTDFLTFRGLL